MFKKKLDSLLAIDLAPEAVRVLDVSLRRDTPVILDLAGEMLPPGGLETLPDRQMAALEGILDAHRLRGRACVATVPTSLVTTRSVLVDPSKPGSPEDQIKQTLRNIVACDARDLLFDFWNVSQPNEKSRSYEVLVVSTQRQVVHKYLDGFARLKLSCRHLDVAPCALASLVVRLLPEQESMLGTVVLGDTLGYFAVVDKQRVLFWRPFELPVVKAGAPSVLERIGHEISKCVSHMVGSNNFDTLGDIIVFGNGAQDEAFSGYLKHRFNLRVRAPSPFEALAADAVPANLQAALAGGAATHYAAALGLALQPEGENHG
jgi:Tfp pilus assembly PilM family ATPase